MQNEETRIEVVVSPGVVIHYAYDHLTFQIGDSPPVEVPLQDWIGAVSDHEVASWAGNEAPILHSPDGLHWSLTEWEDLVGQIDAPAGNVAAFVTENFVLLAPQPSTHVVWVGHPTGDTPAN